MVLFSLHSLQDTKHFAEILSRYISKGDVITLKGNLGAGKTAFARYFIQAVAGADTEVPSPTFSLVQTYDTPCFSLWHFDLYRLRCAEEAIELAIEDAFYDGVSLIEWPEIIASLLPEDRLEIVLQAEENGVRKCLLTGAGKWKIRLETDGESIMRDIKKQQFLAASNWGEASRQALQLDASFRRYERLSLGNQTAILMDAPPEKENIRPFITVSNYLSQHELGGPEIIAFDTENGFMVLEDLGDDSYTKVLAGTSSLQEKVSESTLYSHAIDVLIKLHACPLPATLPLYDEALLFKEAMLLLEWYFPVLNGEALSPAMQEEYKEIWQQLYAYLHHLPQVVVLRDYHADNLMWLPERTGVKKVGLLDFQDAVIGSPAYDIVSLLEDARRDVGEETVSMMITHYLTAMPQIARKDFLAAYAILGAQRNCKIIGIFSRLAVQDGKSSYLRLLPRVWGHVMHDLRHPLLLPLKNWLSKAGCAVISEKGGMSA